MSEEKTTEKQECKCFCKSEAFRKFVVITLGTFTGVYMALSLFTAIHKPPMPCSHHFMAPPAYMYGQMGPHRDFKGFHKFQKEFKGDFDKVKAPKDQDKD